MAVVAHVVRYSEIDLAGGLVPKWPGIAIHSHGAVDSLPGFKLLAGASVGSQHFFQLAHLPHGYIGLPFRRSGHRPFRDWRIVVRREKSIHIAIDIDDSIAGEVYRVRIESPGSTEEVRMEDLKRQRLPAPRGAAGENARIRLPDDAKMLLHVRDQLVHDGITVRPVIGRVHGGRIVKIDGWVLEGYDDHARKARRRPALVQVRSGDAAFS